MKKQLVVNWHILEACNFGCRYCFAHWPSPEEASVAEIWTRAEEEQKQGSMLKFYLIGQTRMSARRTGNAT